MTIKSLRPPWAEHDAVQLLQVLQRRRKVPRRSLHHPHRLSEENTYREKDIILKLASIPTLMKMGFETGILVKNSDCKAQGKTKCAAYSMEIQGCQIYFQHGTKY